MTTLELRTDVLRSHGASDDILDELLRYTGNAFPPAADLPPGSFPLEDEPFVSAWQDYAKQAGNSLFEFLRQRLVQLQFPIGDGIGETEHYQAVTRRGAPCDALRGATGLALRSPGELRLEIYATPAGRIPVLGTTDREDFVDLARALTMRNRAAEVPASIGAWIVAGFNNWDRVRAYRREWERSLDYSPTELGWEAEFRSLVPRKHLYQDRFILLSGGYYSGIPPQVLGMDASTWREKSMIIRRQHECTHYFTRRVLSSMRNHLADELIADYCGIVAAEGFFRADWFLHFMGVEDFPAYRIGGRLENYRGDPPLSDEAFRVLQSLVRAAARSLERFSLRNREAGRGLDAQARTILALTTLTLEELAQAPNRLADKVIC